MNLDDQFELGHFFLTERICRVCGIRKNLIDGFYRTKKNHTISSSYSYECKECTTKRIKESRKSKLAPLIWEYPDW